MMRCYTAWVAGAGDTRPRRALGCSPADRIGADNRRCWSAAGRVGTTFERVTLRHRSARSRCARASQSSALRYGRAARIASAPAIRRWERDWERTLLAAARWCSAVLDSDLRGQEKPLVEGVVVTILTSEGALIRTQVRPLSRISVRLSAAVHWFQDRRLPGSVRARDLTPVCRSRSRISRSYPGCGAGSVRSVDATKADDLCAHARPRRILGSGHARPAGPQFPPPWLTQSRRAPLARSRTASMRPPLNSPSA